MLVIGVFVAVDMHILRLVEYPRRACLWKINSVTMVCLGHCGQVQGTIFLRFREPVCMVSFYRVTVLTVQGLVLNYKCQLLANSSKNMVPVILTTLRQSLQTAAQKWPSSTLFCHCQLFIYMSCRTCACSRSVGGFACVQSAVLGRYSQHTIQQLHAGSLLLTCPIGV